MTWEKYVVYAKDASINCILTLTLFVHALSEYCRMVLFTRASPLHVAEAISTAAQALPTAVEEPVFVCCRL